MARTRIRAGYVFGTLSASLTSSGTTMNGAALARLPAIDSTNEFCAISIHDPTAGTYEIVYVTAHTAAATSATIVRGREGTTGVAWASGDAWLHGPTYKELPSGIDVAREGNLGYDLDFDGYSTSLPSGWGWTNQGTSTFVQEHGAGTIYPQSAAGVDAGFRIIDRAIPVETTWEAVVKMTTTWVAGTSNVRAGIILRDSASGKLITFGPLKETLIENPKWTAPGTFSANFGSTAQGSFDRTLYLRIKKTASTTYDFSASNSGVSWLDVDAARDVSAFFTPDSLGLICSNPTAAKACATFHWFRVR